MFKYIKYMVIGGIVFKIYEKIKAIYNTKGEVKVCDKKDDCCKNKENVGDTFPRECFPL